MRIVKSRRSSHLSFEHLKKIGVVLKRAKYFITCEGKMMYHMRLEQQFLTRQLTGEEAASNWEVSHPEQYQQLSLFDAARTWAYIIPGVLLTEKPFCCICAFLQKAVVCIN